MSATSERLSSRSLDHYLPDDVRAILEERFWRTVEEKSTLEAFSGDETIVSAPELHVALFSDHGVVHARDVAAGTLELADVLEGGLLPARPPDRREFVVALAVLIAYTHDVGMNDPTPRRPPGPPDLRGADPVLRRDGRRVGAALGGRRPGRLSDR